MGVAVESEAARYERLSAGTAWYFVTRWYSQSSRDGGFGVGVVGPVAGGSVSVGWWSARQSPVSEVVLCPG